MTFDLISGLHMQIQTWHPPLRLCIHAKYYVKSGLTNVLKNANKTKNMHLFSIRIANYNKTRVSSSNLWGYRSLGTCNDPFIKKITCMRKAHSQVEEQPCNIQCLGPAFIVHASSEGYGETARLRRFTTAFDALAYPT